MAPESERANECQRCDWPRRKVKDIEWYPCTNPACKDFEPTCSEVVERLVYEHLISPNVRPQVQAILDSWRERRVQELEAEHELFLSQLKTALGIADDGRVWFGTGLLARAETLVKREAEWREQIRKGAKHE